MKLLNTFDPATTEQVLERVEKLTPDSQPLWGKMNVAQMLAHLNVAYEMAYDLKKVKNNSFSRLMLKLFVKGIVVGEKPYKKNSRTAPAFLITDPKEFEQEKNKFIDFVQKTEANGAALFEGKESVSFGQLTSKEWSNMFYKHLDHHLSQFGV